MNKLTAIIGIGTILMVIGILVGVVYAEPENCEDWTNCNMNSPSFDGICCRICFMPELDHREWVCVRVSDDIGFPDEVRDRLPQNHEFALDSDIDYIIENHVREIEE